MLCLLSPLILHCSFLFSYVIWSNQSLRTRFQNSYPMMCVCVCVLWCYKTEWMCFIWLNFLKYALCMEWIDSFVQMSNRTLAYTYLSFRAAFASTWNINALLLRPTSHYEKCIYCWPLLYIFMYFTYFVLHCNVRQRHVYGQWKIYITC